MRERETLDSISNLILLTKNLRSDGGTFLLYNPEIGEPVGYIAFGGYDNSDILGVYGAFSEHGYGPLLYEMAMTYIYPNGLSPSQDGSTSGDALYVWDRFANRGDIKKEKITGSEPSEFEKEVTNMDYEIDDYMRQQIGLLRTKFIYTFGKDKLMKIIGIGKEYASKNNISDDDIEHMTWDLE